MVIIMKYVSILLAGMIATTSANAADKPSNPKEQTSWNLYVDAKEAYVMKQEKAEQILFVRVRVIKTSTW